MEPENKVQEKLNEFYDAVASIIIEHLATSKVLHRVIDFREIEYVERMNMLVFLQQTARVHVYLGNRSFDIKEVIERIKKNWKKTVQVIHVSSLEYTKSCIQNFCGENVKKHIDEKYITFYGDQGAFKIEILRALSVFNTEVVMMLEKDR